MMPYEPVGDDDEIKKSHLPPTFTIHRYKADGLLASTTGSGTDVYHQEATVERQGYNYSEQLTEQGKAIYSVSFIEVTISDD